MSTFIRRMSAAALAASTLALITLSAPQAHAQFAAGPRWLGWLGCWSAAPAGQATEIGPNAPRTVCITPTRDPNAVEISAIAEGAVVSRDHIDASGRPQPIDGTACRGTQTARWSGDGRRVFLKSSVNCEGVQTEMSAILAMTNAGNWLDVRRVAAGQGVDVRVARYRDVGIPRDVPAEVASLIDTRGNFISQDARSESGAPVGTNAIIEASRLVDSSVVEAWIVESGQRFAVDAHTLALLADAGVPARVTDAMVSTERNAQVAQRGVEDVLYYSPNGWNGHNGRGSADAWNQGTTSRVTVNIFTTYDPWGFGYWPYGGYRYGYAPFGYGFRYGPGSMLGYEYANPYGVYWGRAFLADPRYRFGYTYPPTIVLHNDATGTAPHGRSAKGDGYTPGTLGGYPSNDDPRTAHPRTERPVGAVADVTRPAPPPERKAEPKQEPRPQPPAQSRPETRTAESSAPSAPPSAPPRTAKTRP